MKRTILSMMLVVVAMCGWAANDNAKLKVNLDIVDFGDTVVVYRSGHKELIFIGKNGKFEFELQVDTVCQGIFLQPKLLRGDMEDARFYSIPFVGGEEVRVWDTDKERYDVDGTGFYADYHKVDLFNENAHKGSRESWQQALIDYIKANPKQEAAIWLLRSINSLSMMKEAYTFFDASVREGRMKPLYDSWVAAAEKELAAAAAEREAQEKKQASGLEAPVFTLNDLDGKSLSLTSLRGKYVILDFWGSWCIWCIKGFPKMKEYYAKYPGKFEILGVDCNDTEEKWKDAVKKHELPWLHVYCPKVSTVLADYGITGFPTKIIIGPDGKIVKSIVGEDPSFYTLLDELFGK
jgi:thiol-disulfide isomerase/thioredoxin